MKSKPTATPWGRNEYGEVVDSAGERIAVTEFALAGMASARVGHENTKLILRSVNSHDQLVAALEKITKEYIRTRAQQDGLKMDEDWSRYEDIVCVENARKAIAAARAK